MYYASTADLCPNTSYKDECDCASDEACVTSGGSAHHKNIYNVLYNLQNPDEKYCVRMLFSGHAICYEHDKFTIYGMQQANKCVITGNITGLKLTQTVIHEFGHFYNAPDHYDTEKVPSTDEINSNMNTNLFNRICMFGEDKLELPVLNNSTICAGCRAEIQKNLSKYNHK